MSNYAGVVLESGFERQSDCLGALSWDAAESALTLHVLLFLHPRGCLKATRLAGHVQVRASSGLCIYRMKLTYWQLVFFYSSHPG
jgi:hypothetical protein